MPDGTPPRAPLRTYFSVSTDGHDQRLLSELRTWLRHQESCGWLQRGRCRAEISAGERSAELAADSLRQADLIFVLLSVEYLESDDCMTRELAPAILLQEAGLAHLVLIHLRAVPMGELTVMASGERIDLRRWDWLPKGSTQPVDSERRHKREATWQKVEQEVRNLVLRLCVGTDDPSEAEFARYQRQDEGGLGSFLDRFNRVIGAGLRAGSGRVFPSAEVLDIARKIYWDLFCAPTPDYVVYDPQRDRSFAHFIFKVAHILGQSFVRCAAAPSYSN